MPGVQARRIAIAEKWLKALAIEWRLRVRECEKPLEQYVAVLIEVFPRGPFGFGQSRPEPFVNVWREYGRHLLQI